MTYEQSKKLWKLALMREFVPTKIGRSITTALTASESFTEFKNNLTSHLLDYFFKLKKVWNYIHDTSLFVRRFETDEEFRDGVLDYFVAGHGYEFIKGDI